MIGPTHTSKWEHQFKEYHSLLEQAGKGETKLRFNRSFIQVSDIALQFFCEKKVEMTYLHGDIETESKILGTEGHKRLLQDGTEIKMKTLWKEIYGKKPVLALELLLLAKYQDVILVGRPDSILFISGVPKIIFEYKFTKGERPFRTHHVQAQTYGILLRNIGFNTEKLLYALVLTDPKAKDDKELGTRVYEATMENGLEGAVLSVKNARIYVNKFDVSKAERDLGWAFEFWKNRRKASQTVNSNKCKSCEYIALCEINQQKESM